MAINQTTTVHMFYDACRTFHKKNAVLVKKDGQFQPISHNMFKQRVSQFGRGLMAIGMESKEHVAILAETRFEWGVADLAITAAGGVVVPIYPSNSAEIVSFILNDSRSVGVVVSSKEQAEKVLHIKDEVPQLRFIIMMDENEACPAGVQRMHDIEQKGNETDNEPDFETRLGNVSQDDILTIIYTSGTTGNPKGVVLTQDNVMSNVRASLPLIPCGPEDTCLSHLPLSHILERMAGFYCMTLAGATIAYAEDIKKVPENISEVRPTILISVPRLYEKIYTKVMTNAAAGSTVKRGIFKWALATGRKALPYLLNNQQPTGWLGRKYNLAHKLVFSKVLEKTGGNLRLLVSGGAPLSKEVGELFLMMGLKMLEGYGLTETSPVLTFNPVEKIKPGTVGPPIKGVTLKIAEDGEILAKGPNIMQGYFNNPQATKEAMVDGWFHTGDVGMIDQDGYLRITDRKKEILVTSGGKNIAPQPVENALKLSNYIEQAILIGDQRKFISALIVPPWETVEEWAAAKGWTTNPEALVKEEAFIKFMQEEIHNQTREFAHYEKVKVFRLVPRLFAEELGELTPSLKMKRKNILKNHAKLVDEMYPKE